jgi:thioesterase domain-containing protein
LPEWYLRSVFRRVVNTETVRGTHIELMRPPAVKDVGAAVTRAIARVAPS